MKRDVIAIEIFDLRIVLKKSGINTFMSPPKKIKGIVPIKIDFESLFLKNEFPYNFDFKLFKLKRSSLKYQIMAKTLPSWIIADNEEPGSSIPKKEEIIFR